MRTLSRRAILSASAALAAAPATTLPAIANAVPDPLISLGKTERSAFRKWEAANLALDRAQGAFLEKYGRWPDEERDELGAPRSLYDEKVGSELAWEAALEAMTNTPANTIGGVIVKLRQLANGFDEGQGIGSDEPEGELFLSALADLERLVGGVS